MDPAQKRNMNLGYAQALIVLLTTFFLSIAEIFSFLLEICPFSEEVLKFSSCFPSGRWL